MRYFWLIGALVFSLGFADDGLGDLVRKTEGKKGGNKPAPSRASDNNSSPSRSSSDSETPSPNMTNDDPFRKKPRSSSGNAPQPHHDSGRVPLEAQRVPLEARPVPFEARPVLTPPSPPERISNRPVPLEGGNLPALVRRTEGMNPARWRDRYGLIPIERTHTHSGFCVYYRFGNLRFEYGYYYIYPDPYRVVYAPYWYYDPCPPFVLAYRVVYLPPRPYTLLVEVPIVVESPYYLERRPRDTQYQLLSDLRAAWILRDPNYLTRYIRPESYIAIYLDGQYAYSLPAQDYIDMTRDAIRSVRTEQMRFYRVAKRGDTQLVVRGEHQYIDDATGVRRAVYIHYTFEQIDGQWYLLEAGSSANRL